MEFIWQWALPMLAFVPMMVFAYVLAQRRRARFIIRYSNLSTIRDALGKRPGIRRHIPPLIYLLAITVMLVALARPHAVVINAKREGLVVLAMDVSGSMRADDIKPNRLEAAKAAARAFVERQSAETRIGVVAFSGTASIVQAPTTNRDSVLAAINRLTYERSTAIGSGILTALEAIAERNDPIDFTRVVTGTKLPPAPTPTPVPLGTHIPAIIVLLTDGQNVTGPSPLLVAQQAADRGVRVFTIGAGTVQGTTLRGQGGFGFRTELDERTLQRIADLTGGMYFHASDENALLSIYKNLDTELIVRTEKTELTAGLTAIAILLSVFGALLSLIWFNRLP